MEQNDAISVRPGRPVGSPVARSGAAPIVDILAGQPSRRCAASPPRPLSPMGPPTVLSNNVQCTQGIASTNLIHGLADAFDRVSLRMGFIRSDRWGRPWSMAGPMFDQPVVGPNTGAQGSGSEYNIYCYRRLPLCGCAVRCVPSVTLMLPALPLPAPVPVSPVGRPHGHASSRRRLPNGKRRARGPAPSLATNRCSVSGCDPPDRVGTTATTGARNSFLKFARV